MKRWTLTLTYRTDNGPLAVEHDVEELEEIHDLVERGPDWNTLIAGRFVVNPGPGRKPITVEQSEKE